MSSSEFQPPDPPEHPCKTEDGWDHSWVVKSDSDDTGQWQFLECVICGETDYESDVTDYLDDCDDDYY